MALFGGAFVDRATSVAGLQMHLRATVIAKTGTSRIQVIAEEALKREY